ncbi:hypothetical protein ACIPSE_14465 [Streptomyces sp. NPDC090106]|uniref:hypothetical protein n=1 Tax=Streptomyces sp. NPDC090106 TaxID=3365946 RepID=UPI00381D1A5B
MTDNVQQHGGPNMNAVDDAAREMLRQSRLIQNERSDTSGLLSCFNELADLVGWDRRADARDALALARLCRHLATLIRSGSWAILRHREKLPPERPALTEATTAEEVGYAYLGLQACGAVGWEAKALDDALWCVVNSQLAIPGAFCTSLINDLARGVRQERKGELDRIVHEIAQLTSPVTCLKSTRLKPTHRKPGWGPS